MVDPSSYLLPGRNPTGGPSYGSEGFVPGAGKSSGANPILMPHNLPVGAPPANPYTGTTVPSFGANAGPYSGGNLLTPTTKPGDTNVSTAAASPVGGMSLMSDKDISRMYGDLKKTYGDGVAHAILDFLTTGAGFNQKAVDAMLASLQPGIERGTESLMNQFSMMGNRFSSGAQIGLADFLSQVQLNEGQIESQMYEHAVDNFINVLMGTAGTNAQRKANSPSFMDTLSGALGLAGSGAQGLLAAGVGGGSGGLSSILSGIGAFAGLV